MNLAFRMRPQKLDDFIGQEHILGKGKLLRNMIEKNNLASFILWGPPGSGKTTIAYIIANCTDSYFYFLSGVSTGKDDLKQVIDKAKKIKPNSDKINKKNTILFIDEIHRWNKAQQDALLPHVESGLITLIGATTENPSFEVISPLLSRCKIFILNKLTQKDLKIILFRALTDQEKGLGKYKKTISEESVDLLINFSAGDARVMLNALELAVVNFKKKEIDRDIIREIFQKKSAGLYDKKADEHYNIISAYIKSLRGSDPDAALYYLVRMLENGEDPKFIARRMIIFASEDVGLADRGALLQANQAFEAVDKVGMPEAQLILAHITVYLALAKKSRATTNALAAAKKALYEFPNEPIPLHLRNAPTKLMSKLGYGKNYIWSEAYVGPNKKISFLPEKLKNKKFLNLNNT